MTVKNSQTKKTKHRAGGGKGTPVTGRVSTGGDWVTPNSQLVHASKEVILGCKPEGRVEKHEPEETGVPEIGGSIRNRVW